MRPFTARTRVTGPRSTVSTVTGNRPLRPRLEIKHDRAAIASTSAATHGQRRARARAGATGSGRRAGTPGSSEGRAGRLFRVPGRGLCLIRHSLLHTYSGLHSPRPDREAARSIRRSSMGAAESRCPDLRQVRRAACAVPPIETPSAHRGNCRRHPLGQDPGLNAGGRRSGTRVADPWHRCRVQQLRHELALGSLGQSHRRLRIVLVFAVFEFSVSPCRPRARASHSPASSPIGSNGSARR